MSRPVPEPGRLADGGASAEENAAGALVRASQPVPQADDLARERVWRQVAKSLPESRRSPARRWVLAAAAVALLLTAAASVRALWPAGAVAQVELTAGPVLAAQPSGSWNGAQAGAVLPERSRLKTGARAQAVMRLSHAALLAAPDSDVGLESLGPTTFIRLSGGAVVAEVEPRKKGEPFVVQTTHYRVTVKGTVFSVRERAPDDVRVSVSRGLVEVAGEGGVWLVAAGRAWESKQPSSLGADDISARERGLLESAQAPGPRAALRVEGSGQLEVSESGEALGPTPISWSAPVGRYHFVATSPQGTLEADATAEAGGSATVALAPSSAQAPSGLPGAAHEAGAAERLAARDGEPGQVTAEAPGQSAGQGEASDRAASDENAELGAEAERDSATGGAAERDSTTGGAAERDSTTGGAVARDSATGSAVGEKSPPPEAPAVAPGPRAHAGAGAVTQKDRAPGVRHAGPPRLRSHASSTRSKHAAIAKAVPEAAEEPPAIPGLRGGDRSLPPSANEARPPRASVAQATGSGSGGSDAPSRAASAQPSGAAHAGSGHASGQDAVGPDPSRSGATARPSPIDTVATAPRGPAARPNDTPAIPLPAAPRVAAPATGSASARDAAPRVTAPATGSASARDASAPGSAPARDAAPRAADATPGWDAGPLTAPPPPSADPYADAVQLSRDRRWAEAATAFQRVADAHGPRADLALYELGRLEQLQLHHPDRALSAYLRYQREYPDGALAQEVELSTIELLLQRRQLAAALEQMNHFLDAHEKSERAPEVHLLRADVLREQGRCGKALDDYQKATLPAQADDALYFTAWCQQHLGRRDAAAASFGEYLKRFPEGRHAAQAASAFSHP